VDGDGDLLRRFKHDGTQHDFSYATTGVYEGPLAGGKLRLNTRVEHHWNEQGDPNILLFPGGSEVELFHGHGTSGELGARFSRDLTPHSAIELVAFQQLSDESYNDDFRTDDFDAGTLSLNRAGESIADAKFKLSGFHGWDFETGAEAVFNFVDSGLDFTLDGAPLSLSGDATRVEESRQEAFVTATWRPRPKLAIEAGLRYEHSTISAKGDAGDAEKSLSFPKPRLVVTWAPSEHHQVLLRAERTVGQLDFNSFAASAAFNTGIFAVGNPEVEPNKIWTYEARYEYRFAGKGTILLDYTHDIYTDLLARVFVAVDPGGGSPVQYFDVNRNVAKATKNTLVLNSDLPLDRVGMAGGLLTVRSTWQNAPTHDPVTGVPRSISGIQAQSYSVQLSQNINHLNLTWNVSANTGYDGLTFSPRQIVHDDNAYVLNANTTWKPRPKLALTVGANSANGGYSFHTSTVWDRPRSIGEIAYVETTRTYNKTQIYVALRQTF
jgi:outer membrane receptor protein involved in Fe transport